MYRVAYALVRDGVAYHVRLREFLEHLLGKRIFRPHADGGYHQIEGQFDLLAILALADQNIAASRSPAIACCSFILEQDTNELKKQTLPSVAFWHKAADLFLEER